MFLKYAPVVSGQLVVTSTGYVYVPGFLLHKKPRAKRGVFFSNKSYLISNNERPSFSGE